MKDEKEKVKNEGSKELEENKIKWKLLEITDDEMEKAITKEGGVERLAPIKHGNI